MKRLIAAICLLGAASGNASDPQPTWAPKWNLEVHRLFCELQRIYVIPENQDADQRGVLTGTKYYGAFVQFHVDTKQQGQVIGANNLGHIRFWLTLAEGPQIRDDTQAVARVTIGGFEAIRSVAGPAHLFSLSEDASKAIFGRFIDEERVEFRLYLSNGEMRDLAMWPVPPGYFAVYAAMFETCVRENRD